MNVLQQDFFALDDLKAVDQPTEIQVCVSQRQWATEIESLDLETSLAGNLVCRRAGPDRRPHQPTDPDQVRRSEQSLDNRLEQNAGPARLDQRSRIVRRPYLHR